MYTTYLVPFYYRHSCQFVRHFGPTLHRFVLSDPATTLGETSEAQDVYVNIQCE